MDKKNRVLAYQKAYTGDYGFESVLVALRQRVVLDCLSKYSSRVVLEVGCGAELLFNQYLKSGRGVEQWVIVEPSPEFARIAQEANASHPPVELEVVEGFFEDSAEAVLAVCNERPDFIVCSGLLHEVPSPADLLRVVGNLIAPSGVLHANVPNALSFHRRLARAMNLIADERELTERNKQLAQHRVFDSQSFRALIEETGFVVEESGGYLIKPFTNKQMEDIGSILTPEIMDGLYRLGQEFPELAAEIYVNARPQKN